MVTVCTRTYRRQRKCSLTCSVRQNRRRGDEGGRNKRGKKQKESLDKIENFGLRKRKTEATREEGTEGTGTGRMWRWNSKGDGTKSKRRLGSNRGLWGLDVMYRIIMEHGKEQIR